ncbi:MlaA family lipoprotein [Kangiella koreensis]|uniref:VacJ family lipoprotein n=1 Tax=Kangiella koreensis (strain DSM 16069 / JCM 12317 / KCTC 12182 / SW-125) TaxID=523791 RepID=C7RAW8_KANKD|nr:VacJ family lipoprotein [Kangiella koreensis]ACV26410.1 VacJ family lipoprotein [Kangiella koreensis DSM 16069]
MTFYRLILVIAVLTLSACATTDSTNPKDPYEEYNRGVWEFNRAIDKAILKPTAEGYQAITPDPIEKGISNFFSNLGEIETIINDILQAKFGKAGRDTGRFLINSTLGLAGFLDPAAEMGLEKEEEDFGQTLAAWGFDSGPYLMLPFIGPSTARDGIGFAVDKVALYSPYDEMNDTQTEWSLRALDLIQTRAQLLPLEEQLEQALDEYSLVRDAYLQRREFLIYDGRPPIEDDCEFEEDCEDW